MKKYNMISIIIPVYNVGKYLEECLESVVNQSYRNLQIILVDDGSTDCSAEICRKYKEKDERIILIQKENGGLSDARNAGMSVATGEFVFFLDSDDYLENNAIELLEMYQRKNNYDIVVGNYYYLYPQMCCKAKSVFDKERLLNNYEAMEALMTGNIQTFAWGKLMRLDLINKYQFPKGRLFEDHYWTHLVFGNAKRIGIIPQTIIYYRQRSNSISYSFNIKRLDMFEGWIIRKEYIEKYYPKLIDKALEHCANQYIQAAWLILIKMKKNKRAAFAKMQQYNAVLQLQNYCIGKSKKIIEILDKSILMYAIVAVFLRLKGQ